MFKALLVLVLIPFSIVSAAALWQVGYLGLFTQQFANYGTWQVLIDLFIALGICAYWLWQDAQKTGRNPLPWLLLTVIGGSFGPLLYLLTRKVYRNAVQV